MEARQDSRTGRSAGARTIVGVLVGAAVGFGIGAGAYTALAPVLEASDGLVRELQGFVWNLVPLGTIGGGALGWAAVQRRRRGGGG